MTNFSAYDPDLLDGLAVARKAGGRIFFAKNPDDQDKLTSCKEDHLVQQSFLQIIWSICIGQYLAKQNSLKELFIWSSSN